MTLRQPQLTDLAAIFGIEQSVFGSHVYPDFFFRQAFDLWRDGFWLIEDETGAPAGYAIAAPSERPGEVWVLSLALLPHCRGRGMGRRLLEHLLARQAPRAERILLTVDPSNPAAALYRQLGFVVVGGEDDYFGPGETRWVMEWRGDNAAG
nr:N-acetyltransferase [Chromobacterium sp. ASV5]